MSDSQPLDSRERTLQQHLRHERISTPALAFVASPSPAKARRRPATERPSLPTANVAPVKLPSDLFAIATSRSVQGDLALSKALDGIQAAATRLETERSKLVIQSQELQIWDMAREEELVLLRAENEQLEQQLAAVAERVGRGQGRDGVMEGLQYALRKARMDRDAEMREADSLFNQLQEAKAAAMELQELRAAFSAALSSLKDDWSALPLLSDEARDLRARADAAMQDPTNLGHNETEVLLRGLLAIASRGAELQHEVQTLRGEKAALQQALDAAYQQLSEQGGTLVDHSSHGAATTAAAATGPGQQHRGSKLTVIKPGHGEERSQQVESLQQQVSELQAKLEEYRSYLAENHEEIEGLQAELKQLRQTSIQVGPKGSTQGAIRQSALRGQRHHGRQGGESTAIATLATAQNGESSWQRSVGQHSLKPPSLAQQVMGTPTRHVPFSSSPISTVNYGSSSPLAASPRAHASPLTQQAAADFAVKVAELQELAIRAQQQAAAREAEIVQQQDAALEALRQELTQQKEAELEERADQLAQQQIVALAEAQARWGDLSRQHALTVADLEAHLAKLSAQHAEAVAELNAQIEKLVYEHAQALAAQEAWLVAQIQHRLQAREVELQQQHADALAAQAAAAGAHLTEALTEQAARLAKQHAEELRELEQRLSSQAAARLQEVQATLERRFGEQEGARDEEIRRKHAERLAKQATQLARLHAEQATQLGMQHAEKLADREAELLDYFERQMVGREGQLANAHADQLRELEARFAARAADAADAREAHLRADFTEQLAEVRRQHQESLAAVQAEAKMLAAERMSVAVEAAAHAARQLEEDMRQREEVTMVMIEEHGRRMELLRQQVLRVLMSKSESESQAAQDSGAAGAVSDGLAVVGTPAATADARTEDEAAEVEAAIGRAPMDIQVQRLAEHSKQLQRFSDELEVVFGEVERRREQAVVHVERQYVDVVARLASDHEKAATEARAASELREANLQRMLERQLQEMKDAERRHNEQLEKLQTQSVELQTLLREERERFNSSSAALRERATRLSMELDATRQQEAQAMRALAASRQWAQRSQSRDQQVREPGDSGRRPSPTAMHTGAAESPAEASMGAADAWSDGQALFWPSALELVSGRSHSSAVHGNAGASTDTPGAVPGGKSFDPVGQQQQEPEPEGGAAQRPDRDLGLDPLSLPFGLECEATSGPGEKSRTSSLTIVSPVLRRELTSVVVHDVAETWKAGQSGDIATSGAVHKVVLPHGQVRSDDAAEDPVASSQPAGAKAATGAGGGKAEQAGDGGEEVELHDEQASGSQKAKEQRLDKAAAPSTPYPIAAASGSGGAIVAAGLGYVSEAATSVSTDTGYNSENEFYVDDEDDEEHRGRALAEALAQSPRSSQPEVIPQLPPLLQELQQRRRTQFPEGPPEAGRVGAIFKIDDVTCMYGAGRTPSPSLVAYVNKDAAAAAGESIAEGVGQGSREDSAGDDLEATFWGVFPVADLKSFATEAQGPDTTDSKPPPSSAGMAASPGDVTGAAAVSSGVLAAVDLEATLSGPFPMLSLFSRQQHTSTQTAEAGRQLPTKPKRARSSTLQDAAQQPASAPFSFTGPQRGALDWDGMAVVSSGELVKENVNRAWDDPTHAPIDLTESFDFTSGGRVRQCNADSGSARALALEEGGMSTSGGGTEADHLGDRVSGKGLGTGTERIRRACGGLRCGDESGGRDPGAGTDRGGSATIPTSCALPPLPTPRQSLQPQVLEDLLDDSDSITAEDLGEMRTDSMTSVTDGAVFGAFEPEAEDGIDWPALPAAARSASGITPLLLPNPLYNETGEASPPWSGADWSTGGNLLDRQKHDEGGSLPSTTGSKSAETLTDSGDSSGGGGGLELSTLGLNAGSDGARDTFNKTPVHNSAFKPGRCAPVGARTEGGHALYGTRSGARRRSSSPGLNCISSDAGEYTEAQRRMENLGKGAESDTGPRPSSARVTAEYTDEEALENFSPKGDGDSDNDSVSSLLAAGATLSNSEQRRQRQEQGRRMGYAFAEWSPARTVDLLRQGWEISGGVASPISSRSTPSKRTPLSFDLTLEDDFTPQRTPPLTNRSSLEARQTHQEEPQLQQLLLPMHVFQRGRRSSSPARRASTSTPSPRTSLLSKSQVQSLGAFVPTSDSTSLAMAAHHAAGSALDHSVFPGPLSVLMASPPSAALVDRALSPLEARQRSRTVLGRARSRVAELEDQCRALASSLYSGPTDDEMVALNSGTPAALPSHSNAELAARHSWQRMGSQVRWLGAADRQNATQGGVGSSLEQREFNAGVSAAADHTCGSCSSITPVLTKPPPSPVKLVDALEDLRCDLNELEVLHRLAVRAAQDAGGVEGTPKAGLTIPEPRPGVLLLKTGLEDDAVAGAAPAASTELAHVGSPQAGTVRRHLVQQTGSLRGAVGGLPTLIQTLAENAAASAARSPVDASHLAADSQSATGPVAAEGDCISSLPAAAAEVVAVAEDQAAVAALQSGGTWLIRGPSTNAAAVGPVSPTTALSPHPSVPGVSSLDPALVALLQQSIQAQVQEQLGQLEAKLAELQRQNEALLAASTAASTPATPLLPPFLHGSQVSTAAVMTPLPFNTLSAAVDPAASSSSVAGARKGRRERSVAGDGLSWNRSLQSFGTRSSHDAGVSASVDRFGTVGQAASVLPFTWESTQSLQSPPVIAGRVSQQGCSPMSATTSRTGYALTKPSPFSAPAITATNAGFTASVLTDVPAGPYSPEQLSQLPPTVQLFAPPQLRAAALAAGREHVQAHRNLL